MKLEIIRELDHDFYLDHEKNIKIDLGRQTELQPIFEMEGKKIARTYLPECGVINLRDLGGIKTTNNKRIAYHHFYRGATLYVKEEGQKLAIDQLKLKKIIDLRSEGEIGKYTDYVSEGCEYVRYSGLKNMDDPKYRGNFDFNYLIKIGNIKQLKNYMIDMYETMAIDNIAFKEVIKSLKERKTPLYFHCTAGKDRTGVGAALILLCLGVSEEAVYEDYLLSNVYRKELNEQFLSRVDQQYREDTKPLYYVQKEYLQKTLDEIKRIYGDYDTYFEKEHGLTKEMRKQLQDVYCM